MPGGLPAWWSLVGRCPFFRCHACFPGFARSGVPTDLILHSGTLRPLEKRHGVSREVGAVSYPRESVMQFPGLDPK